MPRRGWSARSSWPCCKRLRVRISPLSGHGGTGTLLYCHLAGVGITLEDLRDLGVTLVGDRRRLLDAIAALGVRIRIAATIASSYSP